MVDDENEMQDNLEKAKKPNKVTIRLQCENLISVDFGGESDPYAILFMKAEKDKNWRKLGQTETLNNNMSPQWQTSFMINYYFEKNQCFRVEIYDEDTKT